MIETGKTDGFVPSKTEVVREPRLEKVRVEGRREGLGSVKLFLVAAAIGEEEFIAVSPVLVNPESHSGVQNRVIGVEDEIVDQAVFIEWRGGDIRMDCQEGADFFRDRAKGFDLFPWTVDPP